MTTRTSRFLAGGLAAALILGALSGRDTPAQDAKTSAAAQAPAADQEAIRAVSRDYSTAFNKGDSRAVAALWTEQGECHDAAGQPIVGRAAIEQTFAAFFKENPRARIEVLIKSIRFPAPDLAIEEGVLRQSDVGTDLPATTLYSATHVRDAGRWRMAVSREWGAGEDRLEDLDWLVGQWKATLPDHEVTLTIARDGDKPFLDGRFTKQSKGKAVDSGSMRIGLDPQKGQLRSWHFDETGGHGQALWVRDGSRWVLDSVGFLADGTETASVTILGRANNDTITWRSIDRVMGDQALPDTVPVRLSRIPAAK